MRNAFYRGHLPHQYLQLLQNSLCLMPLDHWYTTPPLSQAPIHVHQSRMAFHWSALHWYLAALALQWWSIPGLWEAIRYSWTVLVRSRASIQHLDQAIEVRSPPAKRVQFATNPAPQPRADPPPPNLPRTPRPVQVRHTDLLYFPPPVLLPPPWHPLYPEDTPLKGEISPTLA